MTDDYVIEDVYWEVNVIIEGVKVDTSWKSTFMMAKRVQYRALADLRENIDFYRSIAKTAGWHELRWDHRIPENRYQEKG